MSELAPPTQPSVIAAPLPTADRPRCRAVPAVDSQPWRRRAVMARRLGPFVLVHLAALGVFFVHFSPILLVAAAVSYVFLMIGSAGWMHRYFSHRCFRTSRPFQFVLAFWGTSANQRGPLWWAAHHRRHHAFSDTDRDPHSPTTLGFWRAHMGWFFEDSYIRTKHRWVRDLMRYPELRFIDRWYILPPMCYWAV
jgi:stearoyl-CoA desaturase (Delta-9 desaturase)